MPNVALEYQIHANASQHGKDWVLRVTVTAYSPDGSEEGTSTFRRHVTLPRMDGLAWQAAVACQALTHMCEKEANAEQSAELEGPGLF